MEIRWTQMKCIRGELTQRREGAEKKMPCFLSPLRFCVRSFFLFICVHLIFICGKNVFFCAIYAVNNRA